MSSYKIYLNICLAALLFSVLTCEREIFRCKECKDVNLTKCTIDNANYTELTEFQLDRGRRYYYYQPDTLQFTNSRISNIPHGIFKHLHYLRWINFSNCHVREVSRSAFDDASFLKDINLSHNDLDVLKYHIFFNASYVEQINLSYNKITQVSKGAFESLHFLKRINLSNNQIKKIESTVFLNLIALRYIDLSVNLIESIDADDLYTNMNLTEFDLSKNRIVTVDQRAFINTKFIKMLNLNHNRINNLSFVDVTINIESIQIGNNNLTVLQTNDNLRILDAPNNQLTSANLIIGLNILNLTLSDNLLNNLDFIKPLSKLKQLNVSFNRLGDHLQPDTFALLTNLNILALESVNFKKIDFQLFSELKQLSFLDISYNELESSSFQKLSFLENLTHLFIDGNRLTQLPFESFEFFFPNLRTIGISGNSWMCTDLLAMLKYFRQINIQIYIDDNQLVINETHIRGIQCTNDQNNTNIGQISPKIPIIHNHDGINNNYMSDRLQLNTLQKENEQLHFDLNQVRSILYNITNTTPDFQDYIDSINSNFILLKILQVGFLVICVIGGALKLYKMLLSRRSYRRSCNTTEDVLNETNI